jgi:ferric-dicitrate binding protein FerR (iron transport regulator)
MASERGTPDCNPVLDRRSFARLAMAVLAWVGGGAAAAQSPVQAGQVEDLRGEGFAEAGTSRRSLAPEAAVFLADRVGTGPASRLTLQLGRQTRMRLGERARITIDRYLIEAGGEITLESGPILVDRAPAAAGPGLEIRSPFALIAVRGTRVFAGPSRGVFGVFVARGRVAVTAGGRRVILRAGQGTDIRRPGEAPGAVTRWGRPRIREALASVL